LTSNFDVVLFSPNIEGARLLGVYSLASHLRQNDISVKTIWNWYSTFPEFYAICKKVLSPSVLVIGVSSTLLNFPRIINDYDRPESFFYYDKDELKKRIDLMRKFAPNAKFVIGGSQISISPEGAHSMGLELFDIVVKGQGEESLLAIVQSLKGGQRFRTESITPPVVSDKIYPYDSFNQSNVMFTKDDNIINGEALPIEFSRGCMFKCSFCAYPLTNKSRDEYTRSFDILREELIYNYNEFGVTNYFVSDDLLNDSMEKVDDICRLADSLPFKLQYSAYVRLDLIRRFPTMADKLRDSGLVSCYFGVETINDRSGKAVGKGLGRVRTDEAVDILDKSWKQSVLITVGMILGLPYDNTDTVHELLEWAQTDIVSRTFKNINPLPLIIHPKRSVSSIEIDNEKYGYDLSKPLLAHGRADWVTKNYSYQQAAKDADYFKEQYFKQYKFREIIAWGNLPYYLALCDNPADILDVCLHDRSNRWSSDQEFLQYVNSLETQHKKRYFDSLIKG